MALKTYGFEFVGYASGRKEPIYREYYFKDTETLTKGDPLNLEITANVGEVDLYATGGDSGFIGIADETVSGTDSTTKIRIIYDNHGDAIYRVTDANARGEGAELDIAGTTGAMTLAADGDSDVIVYANSTAAEPTLVRSHPRARGFTAS